MLSIAEKPVILGSDPANLDSDPKRRICTRIVHILRGESYAILDQLLRFAQTYFGVFLVSKKKTKNITEDLENLKVAFDNLRNAVKTALPSFEEMKNWPTWNNRNGDSL